MRIVILHPGKAYLPELHAYRNYLCARGNIVDVFAADATPSSSYDIRWIIMGSDWRRTAHVGAVIHDYRGLPVPPMVKTKVFLRRRLCIRPGLRIFLNQYVRDGYDYRDGVPSVQIDMGVDPAFLVERSSADNVYDAVYAGELSRGRNIRAVLREFASGSCRYYTLLVIGRYDNALYSDFRTYRNIVFAGYVEYTQVPRLMAKASVGLNFIPSTVPFRYQTSTKFLEYAALGLRIVSTPHEPSRTLAARLGVPLVLVGTHGELGSAIHTALHMPGVRPALRDRLSLSWDRVLDESGLEGELERLASAREGPCIDVGYGAGGS